MKVPPSPLVQVNVPDSPMVSRLSSDWAQLIDAPDLFRSSQASSVTRFFNELFCLKVDATIAAEMKRLSTADLLGRNKVSSIFTPFPLPI